MGSKHGRHTLSTRCLSEWRLGGSTAGAKVQTEEYNSPT